MTTSVDHHSVFKKEYQQKMSSLVVLKHSVSMSMTTTQSAALLDLFKAFDSIPLEILFLKLQQEYNFYDQSISNIGDFLSDRLQKVISNNNHMESGWITLYQGRPHGKILRPLPFNLYINSLHL